MAAIWMSPAAVVPGRREMRLAPIAGGSPELNDELPGSPGSEGGGAGERQGGAPMPGDEGAGQPTPEQPGTARAQQASRPATTTERVKIGPISLAHPELTLVAVVFAAASVVFGIIPSPMFHLASHAATLLGFH